MKNAGTVVIADDEPGNVALLERLLAHDGYTVFPALDGKAALELVRRTLPDLVLTDVMMPKLDGFGLCRRIKEERATCLTPVVLISALGNRDDRIEGINAGADDFLTKPVDPHELRARVRSLVRMKRYTDELDFAQTVILSLGLTVEARDPYTLGHCERMAAYAAAFGAHLKLPQESISALHRGGYLHDVGKVGVSDAILLKPGRLTADERALMERHSAIGEALCGELRLLRPVKPIIRHHHERWDGSGYPDGLHGDAIPLLAQIVGIVDVYDALTTDRVYRSALSEDAACIELHEESERGWHSASLVSEFETICRGDRFHELAESGPGPLALADR